MGGSQGTSPPTIGEPWLTRFSFLPPKRHTKEALAWYHARDAKAGLGFEEAVENALQRVLDNPQAWPTLDDRHRMIILDRYPYHLVYRVSDAVVIVAVAHGRRRPKYWKNR